MRGADAVDVARVGTELEFVVVHHADHLIIDDDDEPVWLHDHEIDVAVASLATLDFAFRVEPRT